MDRGFRIGRFCYSFGAFLIIYLLLYFYGDLYISEYAKNTLRLENVPLIKGYNTLCSFQSIEIGTFLLVIAYLVTNKYDFSKMILCVAITLLIAVLFGDNIKFILGRARPPVYFEHHIYGMQWFQNTDLYHSTPSGHAIRAMAISASVMFLFNSRWLKFALLAFALTQALCRVVLLRHYLSDVIFGLWLGYFIALYINSTMFCEEKKSGNKVIIL